MPITFSDNPFNKVSVDSPFNVFLGNCQSKSTLVKFVVAPEYCEKIVYRPVWPFEYMLVCVSILQSTASGKASLLLGQ
jgi:hypothetical protein